nr:hypothetical protein [Hyphomicrobium sp.]
MDDDEIVRSLDSRGLIDHLLENWPIVIERRGTRFGKDCCYLPAVLFAIRAALGDLIRQ